jgi:hypothetical protein
MSRTDFINWSLKNHERLHQEWTEHIQAMQDSMEHKQYLYKSDKCYEQFCEDLYEAEREPLTLKGGQDE